MADVAARVGVSRALVSLVFRNARGASQRTRERVFRAADDIGYQPDAVARVLRGNRNRQLGVVYGVGDPFEAELVEALYPAAEERGYHLVLSATTPARDEERAVEDLISFRSEALILVGPESAGSRLDQLAARTPVVTLGKRTGQSAHDSVRTNDSRGVRKAVDHLVDLGHRTIGYIDGGSLPGAPERRRGYRRAMRRHELASEAITFAGDYSEDSGVRSVPRLLASRPRPTAVITGNDRCAAGVLHALSRHGVNVPEELSVVGYDDSQLARLSHVRLTTVRQDTHGMAESAVRAAVERLDGGRDVARNVVLTPELVIRDTTARPPE